MTVPNESIVREVLLRNERGVLMRHALASGWQTLKDKYPERGWWRRKSTQRHILWEEAVNNVIASLQHDKAVRPVRHHDTVSFIMEDKVLVRVKKADMELNTSNYQTPLASLFHQHKTDLFGFDGLQRVEAAYVLNRFQTELAWIGIVAREKKKSLFHFEFNELSAPVAEPLPFPVRAKKSPADLAKIRRLIDPDKKRDQEGE